MIVNHRPESIQDVLFCYKWPFNVESQTDLTQKSNLLVQEPTTASHGPGCTDGSEGSTELGSQRSLDFSGFSGLTPQLPQWQTG